jgi:hypothetical protein
MTGLDGLNWELMMETTEVKETVKTNGTRYASLEERIKELEMENKHLRSHNIYLRELLWDWGIDFNERTVH